MNDLLSSVKDDAAPSRNAPPPARDVEAGAATSYPDAPVEEDSMEAFFSDVAVIKGILEKVRKHLAKLQAAHEESRTATRGETMKRLRASMSAIIEETSVSAREAKLRLENLDAANARAMMRPGAGEGTSEARTRTTVATSMKMKLKAQMAEFQDLRAKLSAEYKEVVERRYFAVTGAAADEATLDHLIETGESETIFQKAIMEQGRGQILDTVAEIQERHDAVKELERKLLELHQIFLDMSVLVEAQGEMLDNVEAQVGKSVEYVAKGNAALVSARAYQKSSRKWMCCSLICVLCIACAILLPVLQPWTSGSA